MQWSDQAIILGVRRHGENSVIAEVMTHDRGRHSGLLKNGRSRTMQPVLQPGNLVEVTWRARLDEHLGNFKIEPLNFRAAHLMESPLGTYGVQSLSAVLRLLPERDPHPHLFEALNVVLDNLSDARSAGELYVRFELGVLDDLGFGLDLSVCAASGDSEDLIYVSPKSGRAVSRQAGAPWADKMLALPEFLKTGARDGATIETMTQAFRLSGYFLNRYVYGPRDLEPGRERDGFIQAVLKKMTDNQP